MNSFLLKISLFLFPVLLGLALLPVDERSSYLAMEDDCSDRAIWMYDRVTNEKEEIQLAFLGSSHTINGIDDGFLSKTGNGYKVVNLGYCRLGRDLSVHWLQLLLENHKPEQLVLEVRETEDRYSHPVFPFLATQQDVFLSYPWFNRDLFQNVIDHLQFRLELNQEALYGQARTKAMNESLFGFGSSSDTAQLSEMNRMKEARSSRKIGAKGLSHDFYSAFPRHQLTKIKELCDEQGVGLTFLYLPAYASILEEPTEAKLYRELGELWIPPKSIFNEASNWYDPNHLNETGAAKLSEWLSTKLN